MTELSGHSRHRGAGTGEAGVWLVTRCIFLAKNPTQAGARDSRSFPGRSAWGHGGFLAGEAAGRPHGNKTILHAWLQARAG